MCTRYLQQKEKTELFFHRISSSYSITHSVLAIALSTVSPPKTDDTAFIYPFPQDLNHGNVNLSVVQSAWGEGGGVQSVCRQKLKYFTFNFEPYCICKIFGFCKRILLLVHLKYPVIIEYQRLMMKCHVFAYNNKSSTKM